LGVGVAVGAGVGVGVGVGEGVGEGVGVADGVGVGEGVAVGVAVAVGVGVGRLGGGVAGAGMYRSASSLGGAADEPADGAPTAAGPSSTISSCGSMLGSVAPVAGVAV
jgi:hypothetical protein